MYQQLRIVLKALLVLGLALTFLGCPSAGTDVDGDGDGGEVGETIAEITVTDPPNDGTVLPATITHTYSYTIEDAYFDSTHTYRVTAYFRASDSIIQAYQTTVTDQSASDRQFEIADTSSYTSIATIEVPYRLYLALTDETDGTMVLDESPDVVYQAPAQ